MRDWVVVAGCVLCSAVLVQARTEECGVCRGTVETMDGEESVFGESVAYAAMAALAYETWPHTDDDDEGSNYFEWGGPKPSRLACVYRAARRTPLAAGCSQATPKKRRVSTTQYGSECGDARWIPLRWFGAWHERAGPVRWHSTNALVMGRPRDGALAVAFRGSTDARHVFTNVQPLRKDDDEKSGTTGKTFLGMRRAFNGVNVGSSVDLSADTENVGFFLQKTSSQFRDAAEKNWTLAETLTRVLASARLDHRPVACVGHSLGGALALQLAVQILGSDDDPPRSLITRLWTLINEARRHLPPVAVYTFGEPDFGDAVYYDRHRRLLDRGNLVYRRFVSVSQHPKCAPDLVANIAKFFGAGGHFAPALFVCDLWRPPPNAVLAHTMASYIRALLRLSAFHVSPPLASPTLAAKLQVAVALDDPRVVVPPQGDRDNTN